MKAFFTFLISLACFSLLSGCAGLTHCDNRWQGTFKKSYCGTCIYYKCARACNKCTFNDPACAECWQCVGKDRCNGMD